MHASPDTGPLGRKLASQSPWLLIAVLAHVVVVAVASILYFGHESSADDDVSMQLSLQVAAPPPLDVPVPVIVDRDTPPKVQDADLTPNELEFVPDAEDSSESSESSDADVDAELADRPSFAGGAPAIGNGPGRYGDVPSTVGGPPGRPGKYRMRWSQGPGNGGGGGEQANEAVDLGLRWLALHQDDDGRWDADMFMKHDSDGEPCSGPGSAANDVGLTGLALLAFLGKCNTLKEGRYRAVVRRGVRWLLDQQNENGLIGQPASQSFLYSHAIATLAICEAYGLSEHRPLRAPAQRAINYIASARNPYGVWRYQPRENDGDASITAWMVQALLSAKEFKLDVDDNALRNAAAFFDAVTDPASGRAGYTKVGEGSSRPAGMQERFPAERTEALTGAVLLCRYLMHQEPKDTPVMALAADTMLRKPPTWNAADGSIDMYYWYYASYAMFQVGGKGWQSWSKRLCETATKNQRRDGNFTGSWDPADAWGEDGGRVYSTAMMVLCLEAYYRYGRVQGAR